MQTSRSFHLYTEAQRFLPGGVNSPVRAFGSVGLKPLFIERGSGSKMYDADGNEFIDFVGSWGPLILGHAHPEVLEAVKKTADNGLSFGAPVEAEIELAALVTSAFPSIEMLRMVNSGTEAVMSAVRAARAYTGKDKIIKFEGHYHGHADYLLVKAGSGLATLGIPASGGVPNAYTSHTLTCGFNDLEGFTALIEEYPGEIGCVIVEPFAGNMGFIAPTGDFLGKLRSICDREGIVLIFDEVMTGFRVAKGGAQEIFGIQPDMTTLGKIIGGGMPVGAYGGRRDIMSLVAPLGNVYQAGTLSGNPIAMAAGKATLEILFRAGNYETLAQTTADLTDGIKRISRKTGIGIQVNHCGSMFGFFFSDDPITNFAQAQKSNTRLFNGFYKNMLAAGIYLAPSAFEAGFVSLAHSPQDIDQTLDAFEASLIAASQG